MLFHPSAPTFHPVSSVSVIPPNPPPPLPPTHPSPILPVVMISLQAEFVFTKHLPYFLHFQIRMINQPKHNWKHIYIIYIIEY